MIELSPTRRRELRAAAHHLSPVVTVAGNGLTPAVLGEIERSLQAHELIKIKVQGTERKVRDELMQSICDATEASPVQHIGNILIVWRNRRVEESSAGAVAAAVKSPSVAKAKSAGAFAAAARRAAMIKASADKRRSAEKLKRNFTRAAPSGRGK